MKPYKPILIKSEAYAPAKSSVDDLYNPGQIAIDSAMPAFSNHLLGPVCWKDLNSRLTGCNSYTAYLGGLDSSDKIHGKFDAEMVWGKNIGNEAFTQCNEVTMLGNLTIGLGRFRYADGSERTIICKDIPLMNVEGRITGMISFLTEVPIATTMNIVKTLEQFSVQADANLISQIENNFIDPTFYRVSLSDRELKILYYMIQGSSLAYVAEKMSRSIRTIENAFDIIKSKLNCFSKQQVTQYVYDSGLIHDFLQVKI